MLRFFSQSISRKIIFLVCAVLVFSQVVSFVITFSQISASQERSIEDSFLRIKLLVTTLFETETAKLASQAQMVGTQPVLMAVTGSEDEETIQDSSSEYAGRFQLDFFDILSIDGEPYGEAGGAWDTAALDFFIQAIEEGQLISGYALRERKLAFVAAAPIGLLPNHTGYLILGNYVKDQIAEDIAEIANSDISFLAENEIIATSLAKDEAGMELRRQFMQELQQAGAEAVNGFRNQDYIFKQTVLKGVQGKPLASFVVQSSLAETQQFFYRMLLILLAVSLVVVSVFGLMSAHLARTISTPILALERLAKDVISSLNFGLRAQPVGNDEVCSLAESFNHLLQEIEENHSKLEEYSKNLEKKVEERTATINMILNNVTSGFCLVDKEMVIQEGFTKSCQKIVDEKFAAQQMISQALGFPEREAEHFEACYREVFDDFMPEEVTLGQAPKTAHIGERVVGIQANAVRDGQGQIQSLLFNLSDITALVAAEEQNKVNKALLKILGQKEAFLSFIVDVKNLLVEAYELATVPSPNENRLRIILHTIKGNCGAVGLSDQADLVHHIEDKTQIEKKDIQDISSSFRHFLELHRNVLHIDFEKLAKLGYTVSGESLEALQARLMSGLGQDELLEVVYQWIAQVKLVPAEGLFANLADLVVRVAERVMKQVEFEFVGKEVLVDPEKLKPILQVLPHVIRNCLDHGIEPPYERGDKGDTGHLRLELSDHPDHWTLVIQDDGRGINTDKLVEKSIAAGAFTAEDAAKMSKADKLHLIFADGVSTAEQVSDVSGRGVGMAAVLEAVQTAGGSLKLDSEMGKGTRFTIQIRK